MIAFSLDIKPYIIPIIFTALVAIIAFVSYFYSSKQKVTRILSKLPAKQIGNLKINEFSRITGKALHVKEPLIAPLSNRKCVFYWIKIEQRKKSGKNKHWKTLVNEEKSQEFFLEQNGEVLIVRPSQHPKNYISHLVIDKKAASGTFNNPTTDFDSLLKAYNIKSENFLGLNKSLRYSEGIIEVGERITVAGIATWKRLDKPMEGYSYSKIAELESTAEQKLIITDLPNVKAKKRF